MSEVKKKVVKKPAKAPVKPTAPKEPKPDFGSMYGGVPSQDKE